MKIKVLLSFDHELPLGGLYKNYDEALFNPTKAIIDLANKLGVRINLFSDILSAQFFKKNNDFEFCDGYLKQLHHALNTGHDVQLHIHPHWIKSSYIDGKYIPANFFKLADYKDENYPLNIEGIIENGINYLTDICIKAKPSYKCIAYRAGGFNFEPETSRILNSLLNNGILIESSIVKGFYYKSKHSLINFKNMPKQSNWYISPNEPINIPMNDGLFEIPIASKPAGLYTNITHIINKHLHKDRAFITGQSIHSGKVNILNKLKFVFSVRTLGFDVYTLSSADLINILDYNVKGIKNQEEIILSTVSHPRNMGPHSIKLMNDFINKAREKYSDIEFVSYTEIANQLK
ncbi:MAG: hypothetical protein WCK02_05265 [Bacteroidota bacterium]